MEQLQEIHKVLKDEGKIVPAHRFRELLLRLKAASSEESLSTVSHRSHRLAGKFNYGLQLWFQLGMCDLGFMEKKVPLSGLMAFITGVMFSYSFLPIAKCSNWLFRSLFGTTFIIFGTNCVYHSKNLVHSLWGNVST